MSISFEIDNIGVIYVGIIGSAQTPNCKGANNAQNTDGHSPVQSRIWNLNTGQWQDSMPETMGLGKHMFNIKKAMDGTIYTYICHLKEDEIIEPPDRPKFMYYEENGIHKSVTISMPIRVDKEKFKKASFTKEEIQAFDVAAKAILTERHATPADIEKYKKAKAASKAAAKSAAAAANQKSQPAQRQQRK